MVVMFKFLTHAEKKYVTEPIVITYKVNVHVILMSFFVGIFTLETVDFVRQTLSFRACAFNYCILVDGIQKVKAVGYHHHTEFDF